MLEALQLITLATMVDDGNNGKLTHTNDNNSWWWLTMLVSQVVLEASRNFQVGSCMILPWCVSTNKTSEKLCFPTWSPDHFGKTPIEKPPWKQHLEKNDLELLETTTETRNSARKTTWNHQTLGNSPGKSWKPPGFWWNHLEKPHLKPSPWTPTWTATMASELQALQASRGVNDVALPPDSDRGTVVGTCGAQIGWFRVIYNDL